MELSEKPATIPNENIEKVRELLFGADSKKQEQDFEALRTEFNGKLNQLKKHVDSQFKHIDSQFNSLRNLIAQQYQSLNKSLQKIESSSDEKYILTGQKISEANERNLKTFESISKTQSTAMDEIEKVLFSEIEKLSNDTQRDISILRESKLTRNTLGKILQETVDKLAVKK